MGAGPRYPYPKEVWTPTGGWWTQPKNWKFNTLIVGTGLALITYGAFKFSAEREWARQFREGELSIKA